MTTTPAHRQPWTRLTDFRTKDGLSKTELARRSTNPQTGKPFSVGHINDLEVGRREPTVGVTKALAMTLNISVSSLEKYGPSRRHAKPGKAAA